MKRDRWVTFDCFGTLIDWLNGFRAILAPIAGDRTEALMRAYDDAERTLEAEQPHHLYRFVLTTGLVRAAQVAGVNLASADADLLARRWGSQPLFPDVPKGLDKLRADGWKIGVLTNCDDNLFAETLARHPDLAPDLVITAEQVGSYKPKLGHFERFEVLSGVIRENWIHAANSWFHDIEPAQRYGIKRIWVDRDRTGHDPTTASCVIGAVGDLPAALAKLVG